MKLIFPSALMGLTVLPWFAEPAFGANCVSMPAGVISWWRAEGNANDSISTNHGSLVGATSLTNGMVGQGFLFDGVTSGVNLGNVPAFDFAPDSSFTLEAWFDSFGPTGGGNDGQAIVTLNYNCGPTLQGLVLANASPAYGVVNFLVRDINGVMGFVSSPPVSSNTFHHVVGVREVNGATKTLLLYLDGALVGTTDDPTTASLASDQPDWIGRRNWCGTYNVFNGIIDEVTVYGRALTAQEVQGIYNAGPAGKCFYAVAPTLYISNAAPGFATISWLPPTPGFHLQVSDTLSPPAWTDAPSGTNNPVTVPASLPARFYRLSKP